MKELVKSNKEIESPNVQGYCEYNYGQCNAYSMGCTYSGQGYPCNYTYTDDPEKSDILF